MSIKVKGALVRVLVILGAQAPIWWIKDAAAKVWPELEAQGALDLLVGFGCLVAAFLVAMRVIHRVLDPILIPEAQDEP